MKKLILLSLFSIPILCFSQSKFFELKPNAFISTQDTTKDYLVLEYPNKTVSQLYKAILSACGSVFKSSKDVISPVENETVSIHWRSSELIPIRSGMGARKGCYYSPTMVWHVKDGKIKIDSPGVEPLKGIKADGSSFTLYLDEGGSGGVFGYDFHMFDKNGNVNRNTDKAKDAIENEINITVFTILEKINKELKSDW